MRQKDWLCCSCRAHADVGNVFKLGCNYWLRTITITVITETIGLHPVFEKKEYIQRIMEQPQTILDNKQSLCFTQFDRKTCVCTWSKFKVLETTSLLIQSEFATLLPSFISASLFSTPPCCLLLFAWILFPLSSSPPPLPSSPYWLPCSCTFLLILSQPKREPLLTNDLLREAGGRNYWRTYVRGKRWLGDCLSINNVVGSTTDKWFSRGLHSQVFSPSLK